MNIYAQYAWFWGIEVTFTPQTRLLNTSVPPFGTAVATVQVTPARLTLVPGAATALSAVLRDAAGAQLVPAAVGGLRWASTRCQRASAAATACRSASVGAVR